MNLGNKIRELRRAGNLTQEQLAASLNISPQAVSKWEMGASYPDMTMIPTLAAFFKVSLDELFDFDIKTSTDFINICKCLTLSYHRMKKYARAICIFL